MNCLEVRRLLHAYIDAELDTENNLEIEQHLQNCEGCSRHYKHYLALRTAIREGSLYFSPPELLQRSVRFSVRQATQSARVAGRLSWRSLSVAAALLFVLFGVWGLLQWWSASSSPASNTLAQEVLDSHIRSLLSNHLVDITSSDESTVKPWFTGRLGFSPPVINLNAWGYPMLGGRLDYLDNHMAAAVVYRCGGHVINVFFWPAASQEETVVKTTTLRGYNLTHWTSYGMNCWAVSDLATNQLRQFVQLMQQNTGQAEARLRMFQRVSFWSGGT